MSATGNGTTQYLASAGTLTPLTAAYSWAFWYFPLAAPSTANKKHPFSMTNSGGGTPGGYDVNFAWNHTDAAFYKAAVHRNSDLSFAKAQHPGTPASGAWHHVGGVFNGSTLKLYYDGAEVASVSASAPGSGFGNPNMNACSYDATVGFDDSPVSELAVWSVALTATEMLSLATGTAVTSVQNGSIVDYNKLNTADITTTGPALTNHSATLNTTYFSGMDGGLAAGGASNLTVVTIYGWTPSGGLAIGGSSNLIAYTHYNWTMLGGLTLGGENWTSTATYSWEISGGLALGGTNWSVPTHYTWIMSGGLTIDSDPRVSMQVSGNAFVIASGMSQAFTNK